MMMSSRTVFSDYSLLSMAWGPGPLLQIDYELTGCVVEYVFEATESCTSVDSAAKQVASLSQRPTLVYSIMRPCGCLAVYSWH
jgi:hypothetical protein